MTTFDEAYAFTFSASIEGGVANDPNDRGGLTNNGFTQGLYDAWRAGKKLAHQSVLLITEDEKRTIAREEFWDPCKCDQLPKSLAVAVFDMAVNSGVREAKLTLQRALHVTADGVIGDVTLAAANAMPEAALRFLERRMDFIQNIIRDRPSQVEFLESWGRRCLRLAWMGGRDG
jgi:lysozyme family protein